MPGHLRRTLGSAANLRRVRGRRNEKGTEAAVTEAASATAAPPSPAEAAAPVSASASASASKPPSLWRRMRIARRVPIAILAALAAAVPAGGTTAVSRVNEQVGPDDPTARSWPDEDDDEDHGRFDGERPEADLASLPTDGEGSGISGTGGRVRDLDVDGIPAIAMRAYVAAEETMADADPDCHVSWSLLAAIGRVESNHGRFGGARLNPDGTTSRPIRGVPLDGSGPVARIMDTDDGRLDGDRTYDRAVGPMQFIPSSWRRVASDGNDDGRSDPNNIYDAALAAGVYLCAGDGDLRDPHDREQAVLRYNRSQSYADTVIALAESYEREQDGRPLPDVDPSDTPPAVVGTPTLPPANPGPPPGLGGRTPSSPTTGTTRPRPGSTTSTTRPSSSTTTTTRPSTSSSTTSTTSATSSTTSSTTTSTSSSTTSTTNPGPILHQVGGGRLPSGPWSLWIGGDSTRAGIEMRLPPGTTWRAVDSEAVLRSRWTAGSVDGRNALWGLVAPEVTSVVVTLSDGRTVPVPALESGLPGLPSRAFATTLPEGVTITAIEGRRADGTAAVRAVDVAAALAPVAGFDPAVKADVAVTPVAPGAPGSSTG